MILSKKLGISVADLYFNECADLERADIVRYLSWPEPVPNAETKECWTVLLDLSQEPDSIWKGLDKTARNSIRRAEREGVVCDLFRRPDQRQLKSFADIYDAFAATKTLPPVSRRRLRRLLGSDALCLSCSMLDGGVVVVWHAYVTIAKRVRLLHSVSLFRLEPEREKRTAIARANCLLHWHDIIAFQQLGYNVLDLGGWDPTGCRELSQINSFKAQFGGRIVREFNCVVSASLVGSCVMHLERLRGLESFTAFRRHL